MHATLPQVKNFAHVLPTIKEHIFGPLDKAGYTYDIYAHTFLLATFSNPRNGEDEEPIDAHSLELELPDATVAYSGAEDIDSMYMLQHLLVNGDAWCVRCYCVPHHCESGEGCQAKLITCCYSCCSTMRKPRPALCRPRARAGTTTATRSTTSCGSSTRSTA